MIQIKFRDIENDVIHGGILLDNGDCVCGCCGGLQEESDEKSHAGEDATWEIIEEYNDWVDLDEIIIKD